MTRKFFVAAVFAVACSVTLYASSAASAVDEAPAPRSVGEGDKPGGKGKFGGFGGGKFDPSKFKDFKGKFGKDGGFGGKGGFPFPGGQGKGGFPGGKGPGGDKGGFGKGGFGKKKGGDGE
jgi:hypothetical protein